MTETDDVSDYQHALEVALHCLPANAHPVHVERLQSLARQLPALFAARDTVAAQRPIPPPLDAVLSYHPHCHPLSPERLCLDCPDCKLATHRGGAGHGPLCCACYDDLQREIADATQIDPDAAPVRARPDLSFLRGNEQGGALGG